MITRRKFIIWLLSLGASALIITRIFVRRGGKDSGKKDLEKRLANLFDHKESAKAVGHLYLQQAPDEEPRQIYTYINSVFEGKQSEYLQMDNDKLLTVLSIRRQKDFEEGKVVNLDGWLLSVTEARLCALVYLADS